MRGLAPGIVEDAAAALNPLPLFRAAMGSGYARCKKVTLPVGNARGELKSSYDGSVWVTGPVEMRDGVPHQTRWVYDSDITQTEFEGTPKTEGFANEGPSAQTIAAGVLAAGLVIGTFFSLRR